MSRSIGSAFGTQLTSGSLRPFYAIKMNFTSGTLLLATTYADLVIGGNTYLGSGNILSVAPITETSDTRATGLEIVLNGLDTSILSAGLTEDTQGMVVEVYFGVLTTTDNADVIVDTPYQIFSGFIDSMVLQENGETSNLKFMIENKLITLEIPTDRRYTDQDQQNLFPGDKGCNFVTSLQDKSVAWGAGVEFPQKTT
mgnify:FL=1|tara:strand:- start:203 stop:796 length:594 start_codon:yes stop_codon:yes gene_type:complete